MPEDGGEKPNWWERNVETPVAAQLDRERAAIPENDPVVRLQHDISVGAAKGVYNFGKGIVTGLYSLGESAVKLVTDKQFRDNVLDKADKLAQDSDKLLNGTPEEQRDVANRALGFGKEMYKGIKDQVEKDWEQAGKDGKRAELASKWATQGVLEVASLFVGVGEAKAALKGAEATEKVAELAKTGRVTSNVVSKCEKADELAEIAKTAEGAEKAGLHDVTAHRTPLRQTGAGGLGASADELYDAIRASTTDVAEIAKNTGIKPENIQKVKNHLFYEEHLLDRYVDLGEPAIMARFDSDAGIAKAWEKLRTGNFSEADLQLLRHEAAEANRMRKWGPGYSRAHNAAQRRYPAPRLED